MLGKLFARRARVEEEQLALGGSYQVAPLEHLSKGRTGAIKVNKSFLPKNDSHLISLNHNADGVVLVPKLPPLEPGNFDYSSVFLELLRFMTDRVNQAASAMSHYSNEIQAQDREVLESKVAELKKDFAAKLDRIDRLERDRLKAASLRRLNADLEEQTCELLLDLRQKMQRQKEEHQTLADDLQIYELEVLQRHRLELATKSDAKLLKELTSSQSATLDAVKRRFSKTIAELQKHGSVDQDPNPKAPGAASLRDLVGLSLAQLVSTVKEATAHEREAMFDALDPELTAAIKRVLEIAD